MLVQSAKGTYERARRKESTNLAPHLEPGDELRPSLCRLRLSHIGGISTAGLAELLHVGF